MSYTEEQIENFYREYHSTLAQLTELMVESVKQGSKCKNENIYDHIVHGASRRTGVIQKSFENIYTIFPPSCTEPLPRENLLDVQINLHAFMINIYGIFENWAWAFVLNHDLQDSLFSKYSTNKPI